MPRPALLRGCAAALLLVLLSGCAAAPPKPTPGDPWERVNRGTHDFNDALDRAVLKPVAIAYRDHLPRPVQTGVRNLTTHLSFPITMANDLLQLKLGDFGTDVLRFVMNSTLGLAGLLDPATHAGLRRNEEDFGQTLGRWGFGPGPYVVLPFLGPSSLRDTLAMGADGAVDLRVQLDLDAGERAGLAVVSAVSQRAGLLGADALVEEAYDPYAFVRNAWLQRRAYLVSDGELPPEEPLEDPLEDPEG